MFFHTSVATVDTYPANFIPNRNSVVTWCFVVFICKKNLFDSVCDNKDIRSKVFSGYFSFLLLSKR